MHVFAVPSLKLVLLLFIPYYIVRNFFVQNMSFFGSSWRLLTGFYGNHECCKHREEVYQCYDRFHFMISRDWDEHIFYDSHGCRRGWCYSTSTDDDLLLWLRIAMNLIWGLSCRWQSVNIWNYCRISVVCHFFLILKWECYRKINAVAKLKITFMYCFSSARATIGIRYIQLWHLGKEWNWRVLTFIKILQGHSHKFPKKKEWHYSHDTSRTEWSVIG